MRKVKAYVKTEVLIRVVMKIKKFNRKVRYRAKQVIGIVKNKLIWG